MIRTGLILFFSILLAWPVKAQLLNYCDLHGAVYESEDRSMADFVVYEEDSEAFADFLVYEEENKLYADISGLWYFVENKGLADFKIYFTKEKGEADFVIFFTDSPTFAGCN